jgi:hypothetical protein
MRALALPKLHACGFVASRAFGSGAGHAAHVRRVRRTRTVAEILEREYVPALEAEGAASPGSHVLDDATQGWRA